MLNDGSAIFMKLFRERGISVDRKIDKPFFQTEQMKRDDNMTDAGAEFLRTFHTIKLEGIEAEKEWIEELRKQGVKAAHPDNGWIDQWCSRVFFRHPQFFDGVEIGDKIAIGERDMFKIVIVDNIRIYADNVIYYYYKEIADKTYDDIFTDFKNKIDEEMLDDIKDYKPASKMYSGVDLDCGIIVWFKDGSKMIYLPKE